MYDDWKQWTRLVYSGVLLWVVGLLTQPWALRDFEKWGWELGWVQVSLFAIASGFMFPKATKLKPLTVDGRLVNDSVQFVVGLFVSIVAWLITFL